MSREFIISLLYNFLIFQNYTNVKSVSQCQQILCLKVLANEDTLLPTQIFPRLPARSTFVSDTNFVSGTQKMFLILFRNILCLQQIFPSLRSMET